MEVGSTEFVLNMSVIYLHTKISENSLIEWFATSVKRYVMNKSIKINIAFFKSTITSCTVIFSFVRTG